MCIYIPHEIVALLNIMPFVLIGATFGFLLGEAWAKADEYEEKENGKNKKRRL